MTSVTLIGPQLPFAPETPEVTQEVAPVTPAKRTRKAPEPKPEPTPEPARTITTAGFTFTYVDN